MADIADDRLAEGKLDLVPMIDCIMLLLLFFILTMKFTTPDKAISSLLPTNMGNLSSAPSKPVVPPEQVNICIFPAGLDRGLEPSAYLQRLREIEGGGRMIPRAWLRIGRAAPLDCGQLTSRVDGDQTEAVQAIHDYVSAELSRLEHPGAADRSHQAAVVINCFSGMPWSYALAAYDAVRAYEARVAPRTGGAASDPIARFEHAREVDFAPPLIRGSDRNMRGEELCRILNLR